MARRGHDRVDDGCAVSPPWLDRADQHTRDAAASQLPDRAVENEVMEVDAGVQQQRVARVEEDAPRGGNAKEQHWKRP